MLYHIANTLLVFVFLRGATGAFWRSALVAALFAWHPMHVESVAWASERKDVLSTFFWLLTLLAYLGYARSVPGGLSGPPHRRTGATTSYYLAALVFCAGGLMSKPMVVTLPFALLLLDLWPLNRVSGFPVGQAGASGCRPVSWRRLGLEKVPFFILAITGSIITYLVQSHAGAVAGLPLIERLANAVLAYFQYTAKLFWPTGLAIIYPLPRHWSIAMTLAALLVLLVWTLLCVRRWREFPFLAVGWFWFLGTLVPAIGIIQVGAQAMADRYTYIPSIGFFVAVIWGVAEYLGRRERGKIIFSLLAGAALLGCMGATACQISLWHDSITLFRHAIAVTTDNYAAENCLGKSYEKAGDSAYAMVLYRLSVETEPRFSFSQFNLAMALLENGQASEAFQHLQLAADLDPGDPVVQYDLGIYFFQHGAWTNSVMCFSNSIRARPDFAVAHQFMGKALAKLGRAPEAAGYFREALRLDPSVLEVRTNLNQLLTEHPELR
jgi:Flp pilus assembly protein TadD